MALKVIEFGFKTMSKVLRKKSATEYIGAKMWRFDPKSLVLDEVAFAEKSSKLLTNTLKKENVIAKYCLEKEIVADEMLGMFNKYTKNLDEVSIERLLKLTNENKINLFSPIEKKQVVFMRSRRCNDGLLISKTKGVLNYLEIGNKETEQLLKEMLALEKQGKIKPESINEMLKLHTYEDFVFADECMSLAKKLRTGEIKDSQIKEASFFIENQIPLEVFNLKNLSNYSKAELNDFSRAIRGARCKDFSPEILDAINRELASLVKVNRVSKDVSNAFLTKFNSIMRVFEKENLSLEKLKEAGGIDLQYTRSAFKNDIFKEIEHLPQDKQTKILSKFGLSNEGDGKLGGLPVRLSTEGLSEIETAINSHIGRFLSTENRIVLPKGFEELRPALEEICEAIPEFKYTIKAQQHDVQKYNLAEHMLKAFQENMRNPMYKDLGESDRRILGISTLLHDINKIERTKFDQHALPSAQTVNAIVERMPNLTPMEKDRIVNLVENHHWLENVSENMNPNLVNELATTFRSGNDFKLARIFAESDLKAVNDGFFGLYGKKLNYNVIRDVDEAILDLQSKGRMMYTTSVNTSKALEKGAKIVTIGEGNEITKNIVINSKQMGLDKERFAYHVADDESLMGVINAGGYKKGLVLSLSIGKDGACKTFRGGKTFVIFDKLNMNNMGRISPANANTKYAKSVEKVLGYMHSDGCFVNKFKECYPHAITDKEYALVFREVQGLELSQIATNKNIQKILGSEEKAQDFVKALKETNTHFASTADIFDEAVAMDMRAGAIGIKGKANELSFSLRKFLEESNIAIVEDIV